MVGKIAHTVPDKGFGFIQCSDYENNLFFHVKDLKNARMEDLKKGDDVTFESVVEGPKGFSAREVQIA